MTTTGLAGIGPTRLGAPARPLLRDPLRALVVLGVAASAALHGQMALGGVHGPGWSVLMGAMALLCLSCLVRLVRSGNRSGTMRMTMGMALAMALGHVLMLPLLSGGPAGSGAHGALAHHAAAERAGARAGHGTMLVVVGVELAVAAVAVGCIRRHKS